MTHHCASRVAQISKPTSSAASRPADLGESAIRQVWKSELLRQIASSIGNWLSLARVKPEKLANRLGRDAFPGAPALVRPFAMSFVACNVSIPSVQGLIHIVAERGLPTE